eukprot:scaffold11278_cov145-Isochrysis_galbana.AAC.7
MRIPKGALKRPTDDDIPTVSEQYSDTITISEQYNHSIRTVQSQYSRSRSSEVVKMFQFQVLRYSYRTVQPQYSHSTVTVRKE